MILKLAPYAAVPVLSLLVELDVITIQSMTLADSPLGVRFEITPIKAKQTDGQRGYYWLCLHMWGKDCGYSTKETEKYLHSAVCCEAFGIEKTLEIKGQIFEIPKRSSSNLTIEEYGELITTMLRLAAEDGCVLPEAI